jgi:hypothetical protein
MVWMRDPYRATRDVDLLAAGRSDQASVRQLVSAVCSVPCPEDGLTFDLNNIDLTEIRAEQEYQGQRAVLIADLAAARIRLQIDVGFGDATVPDPEDAEYPVLLAGLPAPKLRVYRRETSIAEKFEAAVTLGRRNSRMKDFHDIWALSGAFGFDGRALRRAVAATFERRRTAWSDDLPDVLLADFYRAADLQRRWEGYVRAAAFRDAPPARFEEIGDRLLAFLGPVREAIVEHAPLSKLWPAGGPWPAQTPK